MERRAEIHEEENRDKVRKELKKSDQVCMCKTVSGITFIYQRSRVMEKLSLLSNLKNRNFRGFLLQSAGDKGRDVCTFTSPHAMLDGIFYLTFFFFFFLSSHTLPPLSKQLPK